MLMRLVRRVCYGIAAWLAVFALSYLFGYIGHYWPVPVVAPFVFYYIALRYMKKRRPDWGTEGLKAGGVWLVFFGVMDFLVMPAVSFEPYGAYLSSFLSYPVYFEVLVVPWLVDKMVTSKRKI